MVLLQENGIDSTSSSSSNKEQTDISSSFIDKSHRRRRRRRSQAELLRKDAEWDHTGGMNSHHLITAARMKQAAAARTAASVASLTRATSTTTKRTKAKTQALNNTPSSLNAATPSSTWSATTQSAPEKETKKKKKKRKKRISEAEKLLLDATIWGDPVEKMDSTESPAKKSEATTTETTQPLAEPKSGQQIKSIQPIAIVKRNNDSTRTSSSAAIAKQDVAPISISTVQKQTIETEKLLHDAWGKTEKLTRKEKASEPPGNQANGKSISALASGDSTTTTPVSSIAKQDVVTASSPVWREKSLTEKLLQPTTLVKKKQSPGAKQTSVKPSIKKSIDDASAGKTKAKMLPSKSKEQSSEPTTRTDNFILSTATIKRNNAPTVSSLAAIAKQDGAAVVDVPTSSPVSRRQERLAEKKLLHDSNVRDQPSSSFTRPEKQLLAPSNKAMQTSDNIPTGTIKKSVDDSCSTESPAVKPTVVATTEKLPAKEGTQQAPTTKRGKQANDSKMSVAPTANTRNSSDTSTTTTASSTSSPAADTKNHVVVVPSPPSTVQMRRKRNEAEKLLQDSIWDQPTSCSFTQPRSNIVIPSTSSTRGDNSPDSPKAKTRREVSIIESTSALDEHETVALSVRRSSRRAAGTAETKTPDRMNNKKRSVTSQLEATTPNSVADKQVAVQSMKTPRTRNGVRSKRFSEGGDSDTMAGVDAETLCPSRKPQKTLSKPDNTPSSSPQRKRRAKTTDKRNTSKKRKKLQPSTNTGCNLFPHLNPNFLVPHGKPAVDPAKHNPGVDIDRVLSSPENLMISSLHEFARVNGHYNVPPEWPVDPLLADWCTMQRQRIRCWKQEQEEWQEEQLLHQRTVESNTSMAVQQPIQKPPSRFTTQQVDFMFRLQSKFGFGSDYAAWLDIYNKKLASSSSSNGLPR